MKKIIIFLTILISTIFSNVVFADIIVPWQNCHDYDKVCYNKCLKTSDKDSYEKKWRCKDKCCIKKKKYCTNENCNCMQENNVWPMCKFDSECEWDCTNWEKSSIKVNFIIYKIFWVILTLLIIFIWIFIYKRKKSKKW